MPEERAALATSLAGEGHDGKACAALLGRGGRGGRRGRGGRGGRVAGVAGVARAEGLAPETPSQHPRPCNRCSLIQSLLQSMTPPPKTSCLTPAKALRTVPASTAPGPSGLRAQRLRDACSLGGTGGFLEQLAATVSLLAACADAAPMLAGASPVAVPKPQGGVRPIAIGEVLRRLTGKCLMELVRRDAKDALFPGHAAVAVPAGAEAAVHTVRAWQLRHAGASNKVLVKLDFANAFNTVSRQEVLSATSAPYPSLTRWVKWCYGGPTTLQFGGTALQSAAGVQQGDSFWASPFLPRPCSL